MASPPLANGNTTTNGVHPSTPPASIVTPKTEPQNTSEVPLTSLNDTGESKRPRDARLIHLVLNSLGITAYQDRVPLQLLDFAYRYTSGLLSDSLRLSSEGYTAGNAPERGAGRGRAAATDAGGAGGEGITVQGLRQAIASRQGHAFEGPLPLEFMREQAAKRNAIALPLVERGDGLQLPPEQYCLTGTGWGIKEEWDSEEDDEVLPTVVNGHSGSEIAPGQDTMDEDMGGLDGEGDEDEEGMGRMEDVFGEENGDSTMAE